MAVLRAGGRQFILLALPFVLLVLVGSVLGYLALDKVIEPDPSIIIEKVSTPGFDSVNDADDQAFIESITFSFGADALVLLVPAALSYLVLALLGPVAAAQMALHVDRLHDLTVGTVLRAAIRRAPRILGLTLVYLGVMAMLLLASVVIGTASPFLLVVSLLALFAAVIWTWPAVAMSFMAAAVSPPGTPAFKTGFGMTKTRWGALFVRLLLATLMMAAFQIPTSIFSSLLVGAAVGIAVVISATAQAAQTIIANVMTLRIYQWAGGPIDPSFAAPTNST
ncbi:MAG: hypothetical protein ACI8Y4_004470 [Candidatus Poriferisodalaceae bacterium]|jgi:hypothetical protein